MSCRFWTSLGCVRASGAQVLCVMVFLLCCWVVAGGEPTASEIDPAKTASLESPLGTVLVSENVSFPLRELFGPDPVRASILEGTWRAPAFSTATPGWRPVEPGARGVYPTGAFEGYVYGRVDSAQTLNVLIQSVGGIGAHVNGRPIAGRHERGLKSVPMPVQMRKGRNEFLYRGTFDGLSVRMLQPKSVQFVSRFDPTLPDIVLGEPGPLLGAVLVYNMEDTWSRGCVLVAITSAGVTQTPVHPLPPLSFSKVPFHFNAPFETPQPTEDLRVALVSPGGRELNHENFVLRVRGAGEQHTRTYRSRVDNSIQMYAVKPPTGNPAGWRRPALVVALHGAEVHPEEFLGQYRAREWCTMIAPMGRRLRGPGYAESGRLDVLEAIREAEGRFGTNPQRRCLTGHSMGGHGVWHIGGMHPDRFAALAPVCGYTDAWSLAGERVSDDGSSVSGVLARATNALRLEHFVENLADIPVLITHTTGDEDVSVSESQRIFAKLERLGADARYVEHEEKPHWWGPETVDNDPIFDLFRVSRRVEDPGVPVRFVTCNPAIASERRYLSVNTQIRSMTPSTVRSSYDERSGTVTVSTSNVAHLSLDTAHFDRSGLRAVEIDGVRLEIPGGDSETVHLVLAENGWGLGDAPSGSRKNPDRAGPFTDVFRNGFVFVVGTRGDREENRWALEKAVCDAQMYWYINNATPEIVTDTMFEPGRHPDRSVVLYGNASTNAAWDAVLGSPPIRIERGRVVTDERTFEGDDLACLFVYPRLGSERALVGVVGGTGITGMRSTDTLRYMLPSVTVPDWVIFESSVWSDPVSGVVGAGYFDAGWRLAPDQTAWNGSATVRIGD